jgi:antitoxin ParD1/3/4
MLREIRESIAAGEYGSTSELMRDALRVWRREHQEVDERLNVIRAKIRLSLDDPRQSLTGEEVRAQLDALFAKAEQDFGNVAP